MTKRKIFIIIAIIIAMFIAFIVSSFADELTLDDIKNNYCATNVDAILYEEKDGELVEKAKVDKDTILVYDKSVQAKNIKDFSNVLYKEKQYYISDVDLITGDNFINFCIEKNFLWAHSNIKLILFEDKNFVNLVHEQELNKDSTSLDDLYIETNKNVSVEKNENLAVIEISENSIKVAKEGGYSGYVPLNDLSFEISEEQRFNVSLSLVGQVRKSLVEKALSYEGNPYVWGGTSLENGIDCSGFTMMLYKDYGISLSHSAATQASESKSITEEELLPGDLVFYNGYKGPGGIGHVAIYIGDGKIVHALNEDKGILISNVNYNTPVQYGRLLDN